MTNQFMDFELQIPRLCWILRSFIPNEFCQEILFAFNSSFYAVALRGGTQDGFEEITNTISIIGLANDVASK